MPPPVFPVDPALVEVLKTADPDWPGCIRRFESACALREITEDERKRTVFLSVCGENVYSLIRWLFWPASPADFDFSTIVHKVGDYLLYGSSTIVRSYGFLRRAQGANESVATFGAELKRLSQHCNFDLTMDDTLTECFIYGLRNERIRRRLLAMKKLDFFTAQAEAIAAEAELKLSSVANSNNVERNQTSTFAVASTQEGPSAPEIEVSNARHQKSNSPRRKMQPRRLEQPSTEKPTLRLLVGIGPSSTRRSAKATSASAKTDSSAPQILRRSLRIKRRPRYLDQYVC